MELEPRNPVWEREQNSRRFIYPEADAIAGVKTLWFRNPLTLVHGREDISLDNSGLQRKISQTDNQSTLPFTLQKRIEYRLQDIDRRLTVADLTDGERVWNVETRYDTEDNRDAFIVAEYLEEGILTKVELSDLAKDPNEKILQAWDFYEARPLAQNLTEVVEKFRLFGERFLAGSQPEAPEDDIEENYQVALAFGIQSNWTKQQTDETDQFVADAVNDLIDKAPATQNLRENERRILFKWIHINTLRKLEPEFPFADLEGKQKMVEGGISEAVAEILADDVYSKVQEFDTTVTFRFDGSTGLPLSYTTKRGDEGNEINMGEGSVNFGDIVTVGQSIYRLYMSDPADVILEFKRIVGSVGRLHTIHRRIDVNSIEALMLELQPFSWQKALESTQIQVT